MINNFWSGIKRIIFNEISFTKGLFATLKSIYEFGLFLWISLIISMFFNQHLTFLYVVNDGSDITVLATFLSISLSYIIGVLSIMLHTTAYTLKEIGMIFMNPNKERNEQNAKDVLKKKFPSKSEEEIDDMVSEMKLK